ncbi:MAG TPA: G5 domain-containing protein [Candidatus Saccharimonadales bacterium]|nr:G5 domain-containing protein [Candidatus Saccharimonadales bacterium]
MGGVKKAGKVVLVLGAGLFLWPVMLGVWLSHHAHRKIEVPVLRYLAIAAIMLPALTVGTAWASAIVQPPPSPHPASQADGAPPQPAEQAKVEPNIEKETVTETEELAFAESQINDATLAKGQTVVRQEGRAGVKTITYELTYTNGQETGRAKIKEEVTTPPAPKLVAVGTKVAVAPTPAQPVPAPRPVPRPIRPQPVTPLPVNNCDPNYTGCVPMASDVDCAAGNGNGPAYVASPVRVIGSDIYDLDRDGDGYGCE